MKVKFALHGCDDSTYMTMDVTEMEYEFLRKIQTLSKETSSYGCMPILEVVRKREDE